MGVLCAIFHIDKHAIWVYNVDMNRGDNRGHPVSDPHNKHYNMGETTKHTKETATMSKMELLAKIELLNKYEAMMEELKTEADRVRDSIKAEMEAREVEELIAGQYIVRWTPVLSNRFDSTSFKKVLPELYQAYTKQVSSRRFTISA